ncbi:UNVERIFIED_CONTAM: hypothetical protein PYX00_011301 [Menopon gallinae]|uniref:DnaJ homolog subfamily B member 9 n=1 Tax=Menopon gallinae TaxID=328185 RepID=A0AAW2H781_9NEOP
MSLYEILQVPRTATPHEIAASYKRLVFQHHPNVNAGRSHQFVEITKAFHILRDPKLRYHYDAFGERALEYLGDNHTGEFIVNVYDRANIVAFLVALALLVAFLAVFPYLLLLAPAVPYSVVFSPLYFAALALLPSFCRASVFLWGRSQYKSERRGLVLSFLKIFFLSLQALSTTLYYDLGKRAPMLHAAPAALLESVVFYETYSATRGGEGGRLARSLLLLNPLAGALLMCGLVSDIALPARCCIPSAIVFHLGLASRIPMADLCFVSLPVLLLSVGAGCFIAGRFYPLGIVAVVLFDVFLAFVLVTALQMYTKFGLHGFIARAVLLLQRAARRVCIGLLEAHSAWPVALMNRLLLTALAAAARGGGLERSPLDDQTDVDEMTGDNEVE